jgi:2-oxoisovalerate dehydrogenase E2 component (dihydrolipoyl transacylase)
MSIFYLPDLGEGLADATVVRWHVQTGDEICAEQLLVSVETDKAIVDIPSPQSGRIEALLVREGEVVPTHAPLVRFADGATNNTDAGSVVGNLPQQETSMASQGFLIGRHRHTEARMQQSRQRRETRAATATETAIINRHFEGGEPLAPMRRAMAEHMTRAHREVVPVTVHDEVTIMLPEASSLMVRLVQAMVAAVRNRAGIKRVV